MALLFMDSFSGEDYLYKWDLPSGNYTTASATPRVPGCYYGDFGTVQDMYKSVPASAQIFAGFAFYGTVVNPYISFLGDGGTTRHITVVRNNSTGVLEIRRGTQTGTLLATGTQPVFDLTWTYIEVSVTVADAGGQVHVRLNGQTTDDVSFTGDTKNGGTNTTIDQVYLYSGNSSGATCYFTDVYIANSTGSQNNTFLGDVVVRTLSPSGNGTDSNLVGSDSDQVNNYQLVDEHPYSTADYVASSTPGDRDTYQMADLAAGITTVYGIQLTAKMGKNDASLAQAKTALRSGGTVYYGADRALTTTHTGYYELREVDPNTSAAWTVGGVNGLEAGMEIV